jgi:hypothetical protein
MNLSYPLGRKIMIEPEEIDYDSLHEETQSLLTEREEPFNTVHRSYEGIMTWIEIEKAMAPLREARMTWHQYCLFNMADRALSWWVTGDRIVRAHDIFNGIGRLSFDERRRGDMNHFDNYQAAYAEYGKRIQKVLDMELAAQKDG